MVSSVVPPLERLPQTLPTDRLTASGRPQPDIRAHLRKIPSVRNAFTVTGAWLQSLGVVAAAAWIDRWWAYAIAFVLVGRGFALLAILAHESAHRLLFRHRGLNDFVGRWGLAYPGFTPLDAYRRAHMAHHRDEMGPDEPDKGLYAGYPITRDSMRRKLVRDLFFVSGWKNLRPLLRGLTTRKARPVAVRILAVQVVLLASAAVAGRWWLYPLLWLAPWMTVWRVINRLRAIAEHGGMERSADRRRTTHAVRQRWLSRFWMVPYNTGWHLAHHVDSGIPWRKLPQLHAELAAAGWITPELEYPSYFALWRVLSSRSSPRAASAAAAA
jgi:fatty acid desaturase